MDYEELNKMLSNLKLENNDLETDELETKIKNQNREKENKQSVSPFFLRELQSKQFFNNDNDKNSFVNLEQKSTTNERRKFNDNYNYKFNEYMIANNNPPIPKYYDMREINKNFNKNK